jgi:Tyrosine phosphatase family
MPLSVFLRFLLVFVLAADSLCLAQTGTSFKHFAEIDKNVYVGSKPHSEKDFEYLRSQHVRYILNARFLPFLSGVEKRKAKKYGMVFLSVPMNASPIPPSRKHVNKLLLTMHDSQFEPIYLHCVLGRDRTSLLSGLYKNYFLGVAKDEALAEMKKSGFRTPWFLHGLKVYFEKQVGHPPDTANHGR